MKCAVCWPSHPSNVVSLMAISMLCYSFDFVDHYVTFFNYHDSIVMVQPLPESMLTQISVAICHHYDPMCWNKKNSFKKMHQNISAKYVISCSSLSVFSMHNLLYGVEVMTSHGLQDILKLPTNFSPERLKKFQETYVNTMPLDVLNPCIASLSAPIIWSQHL